ncbi:MAG: ABC transporter permease [bacterium]|jgi:phospholipid/cholesterol/gamma-HCH transport system permease protein|nr:ABC transporter permease [Planctomycetota bacterium]HIL51369.1 ABC transporter permease [Planctomycetota bacterium]
MMPSTLLRKLVEDSGYRVDLLWQTFRRLGHTFARRKWVAQAMISLGLHVVHVVLVVGLFMGMIVSLQTGIELARIGQQDQIGTIVSLSMAREMGPFITAIILAATAGSSIAAELGTMAVSEELAALEVLSIDRHKLLVLPRVVALAIMCPLLTILCDAVGIAGGGFVAATQLQVSWELYQSSAIEALRPVKGVFDLPFDVYSGLLKSFFFGIIIAVISCSQGLKARGGALGVGHATRGAVRDSIIAIIVANYFLTYFLYEL